MGIQEILVVSAVIAIVFVGPSQLPKLGRAFGETIRELRAAGRELTGAQKALEEEGERDE